MSIRRILSLGSNTEYTISEWKLLEIRDVMLEVIDSHNRRGVVASDIRRNAEKISNSIANAIEPDPSYI